MHKQQKKNKKQVVSVLYTRYIHQKRTCPGSSKGHYHFDIYSIFQLDAILATGWLCRTSLREMTSGDGSRYVPV